MSRRVVVTGAGGFVGSAVAAGFAALGWQVTAVDRAFDDDVRKRLAATDLVTADLSADAPVGLPPARLVVHAAAVTTDPETMGWTAARHIAANTRPLLGLLEDAAQTRPEAFVFLSSTGVFAPEDGHGALTDADWPTGLSPYAVAKRAGELLAPAALAGLAAVHVVRLGYLFGPFETPRQSRTRVSLPTGWLAAAGAGRPLDVRADDPARDWTSVGDLAPALARLIEGPAAAGPVHLGSPHVVTDRALATILVRLVPGAAIATVPAAGPLKPPMAASDVPALRGFAWTPPAEGLAALVREGQA